MIAYIARRLAWLVLVAVRRGDAARLQPGSRLPVLELDDGTAIGGSKEIAAWATANPATATTV